MSRPTAFAIALIVAISLAPGSRAEENKVVIGPRNLDLAEGAQELLAGNAKEGVELTLRGLEVAQGKREKEAALSNLCAGYIMIDKLDTALMYCNMLLLTNDRHWRGYNNRALIYVMQKEFAKAEKDLAIGQELNPNARTLRVVKGMLLDATQPVESNIIIDDRRQKPANGTARDDK
jgi:regulator of sirC expression with transglutaminase-like and TPR domain